MKDTSDRLADIDRCRPKLVALADEAGRDPLLLIDLTYLLIGEANRNAWDAASGHAEYVDELLRLAALLVESIAGWGETGWWHSLDALYGLLDRREFERVVHKDVRDLPELWGDPR